MSCADLTDVANRYGSDKGTEVGNKHGYTLFCQLLFESFRIEEFDFLEPGLLRGGPKIGGRNDRVAGELPSVCMWLDYFPYAVCHGSDISDFSAIELSRFHFHRRPGCQRSKQLALKRCARVPLR